MSILNLPIYRTEAGVHANPAVNGLVYTHCDNGEKNIPKEFKEVLIKWDGAEWIEEPSWIGGTGQVVALRIDNPCEATYSYVNGNYNDFNLAVACCLFIPAIPPGLWLTFKTINDAKAVVADIYNVADWNTLLGGTTYDQVYVLRRTIVLTGAVLMPIGANSFEGVLGLVSVVDSGNTVSVIQASAFKDCYDLETILFIDTATIGNSAFNMCVALKNVSLEGMVNMGTNVFEGCSMLEEISLPILSTAGAGCFKFCGNLRDISLPIATSIGANFLESCFSLDNVILSNAVPFGGSAANNNVFAGVSGKSFNLTVNGSETGDGDIVAVQAANTVTLTTV